MTPTKNAFTLFPFYFQQRSPDPNENYTALVPFYGHLKNRLFRDEIFFVMFPLYSETRKRDVVTDNYLFPVFHVRHGDGLHGWQFWPLVGARTQRGDHQHQWLWRHAKLSADHDKYFALWPIHFWQNTGIGTDNPEQFRADSAALHLHALAATRFDHRALAVFHLD